MNKIDHLLDEIQAAQEAGDRFLEGLSNAKIGKLLLERNIYGEAVHYYQRAASLFEEQDLFNHQVRSLNHLGICLVMMNQPENALTYLKLANKIADKEGDPVLQASIAGNLGLAYSALGDYTKAIKAHKTVMEYAEQLGDQALQLNALINLADSNLQNKNYQSARGFALVALDLAESLNSVSSEVLVYDLLGMISSRRSDLQSAVDYHQQSYLAAKSIGDLQRQAIALANQGLALEGLTELKKALQAMQEAQDIFLLLNSNYVEKTQVDLTRIKNALS